MGKPSWVEGGGRRHHSKDEKTDSPESSEPQFPRRFPRIGTSYQCKDLPELGEHYLSSRQYGPDLMSKEVPHSTISLLEKTTDPVSAQKIATTTILSSNVTGYETSTEHNTTSRGGYLLHPSLERMDTNRSNDCDFWFGRYASLEVSPEKSSLSSSSIWLQQWCSDVQYWHAGQLAAATKSNEHRKPARNSRYKKRPINETVPLPLYSRGLFAAPQLGESTNGYKKKKGNNCSSTTTHFWRSNQSNEGDEYCLEYLWHRHAGSEEQAAVHLWKQWNHMRAQQTVRQQTKRWKHHQSTSWRTIVRESMTVRVSGDFRHQMQSSIDSIVANVNNTNVIKDNELLDIWDAVIACAKAATSKDVLPTLTLSAVAHFLYQAALLPSATTASVAEHEMQVQLALKPLVDHYLLARRQQNKLFDLCGKEEGVDLDILEREVAAAYKLLSLQLDELPELRHQLGVVSEWQQRLERVYLKCSAEEDSSDRNDLAACEMFLREARQHGFRCKELVLLEQRVDIAYTLRNRIEEWKATCKQQTYTLKNVATLVRDVHRLKMRFPQTTGLLNYYAAAEAWVERSNIAVRSRISFDEIQSLIICGREMSLDLSEHLEKLRSRVTQATEWLDTLHAYIPRPERQDGSLDKLKFLQLVRVALKEGSYNLVHELASTGSRIPVEIDCVKLLQVEIDAHLWTAKASKWILRSNDDDALENTSKKGKLDDIREHIVKAVILRERLDLASDEKENWELVGERELSAIVAAANDWLDKNNWIMDNTVSGRCEDGNVCLSIDDLRTIVKEGNALNVNMGNGIIPKINRILSQAEKWFHEYSDLLLRCNILGIAPADARVDVNQLKAAIKAASADISTELQEVLELQNLLQRIETWSRKASYASGDKRVMRGKKELLSINDLHKLIEEGMSLPLDTSTMVNRLQEQSRRVHEWQAKVSTDLEAIYVGFKYLREAIEETYGPPSNFSRIGFSLQDAEDKKAISSIERREENGECDVTESTSTSEQERVGLIHSGSSDCNVHSLIKSFCVSSQIDCIVTPERESAEELEIVSSWCLRSLKYLESPRDIFDQRFFGAFDRFIAEGTALTATIPAIGTNATANKTSNKMLLERLRAEWSGIVQDQLERLHVLLSDRKEYIVWCKTAEQILTNQDNTLETLTELAATSREFPSKSDLVSKVRKLAKEATLWAKAASKALSSDEKMSLYEGKALLEEGDLLGFTCIEMKSIQNGLKSAIGWAKRVKCCILEKDAANNQNLKSLLEEHRHLLFEMSDEVALLQQSMTKYCLCRRPYEGFMIQCDSCDDWFHGPCVGVSRSRVDKVSKFVCLRCSLEKTYIASASAAVAIIRKWMSLKDRKQARHIDCQKFKRKIRKEKKDIEKLQQDAAALRSVLLQRCTSEVAHRMVHIPSTTESGSFHVSSNCQVVIRGEKSLSLKQNEFAPISVAIEAAGKSIIKNNNCHTLSNEVVTPQQYTDGETLHTVAVLNDAFTKETIGAAISGRSALKNNTIMISDVDGTAEKTESQTSEQCCHLSRQEIQANLDGIARLIQGCVLRLAKVTDEEREQKRIESVEDLQSEYFKKWVVFARDLIVPSTRALASKMIPNKDGTISDAMRSVLEAAVQLDLGGTADVRSMRNHFSCMSWCLRAITIFSRQPSADEFLSLVDDANSFEFCDEKAIRVVKSMARRVTVWQNKVMKALAPVPGESKPYHVRTLSELASVGDDIPVSMPMEVRLRTVIEDGGGRYCLCGGPSDGRFMVGCDKCDRWFHGHCVNVDKQILEKQRDGWECPACVGMPLVTPELERFHEKFCIDTVDEDDEGDDKEDDSSKIPNLDELWPPFGLLGDSKASEVLGEECCGIYFDSEFQKSAVRDTSPHLISTLVPPAISLHNSSDETVHPWPRISQEVNESQNYEMNSQEKGFAILNKPILLDELLFMSTDGVTP